MATCVVSGTLLNPSEVAIVGATVRYNIQSPVLNVNGVALLGPDEVTTVTDSSGNWSLTLSQGSNGILSIDIPPDTVNGAQRYDFSIAVPLTSTASFPAIWIDLNPQASVSPPNQLPDGKIWIGNSANAPVARSLSGDATITDTGVLTVTKVKSVKDYGATGDGATDDAAAITAAIASLSSGGDLYFPSGTYLVGSQITVNQNNIRFYGGSQGSSIIKAKSAVNFPYVVYATGQSGLIFENLTFDGNQSGRSGVMTTPVFTLYLTSVSDCTIRNCTVKNSLGYSGASGVGLTVGGASFRNKIIGCTAINCGTAPLPSDGYFTSGTQNLICDSLATSCTDTGFVIESSNECGITGCSAVNCGAGAAITNASNSTATGNYINGLTINGWTAGTTGAIQIGNPSAGTTGNLLDSLVANVTIQNSGTGPCIYMSKTGTADTIGLILSNLRINGAGAQGILINGKKVLVTSCQIASTGTNVQIQDGCTDIVVTANELFCPNGFGVIVNQSSLTTDSIAVTQNRFISNGSTAWAFYCFGTSTNVSSQGNGFVGTFSTGQIGADTTTAPRSAYDLVFHTGVPTASSEGLWLKGTVILNNSGILAEAFGWRVTTAGVAGAGAVFTQIADGIDALSGDVTATGPGTAVATLASVGTAGTYTKVTTDVKGRVTAGTSATLASADFANQGATTTVLHGNAAGNPSFGAVSLTADVSGTLPVANGGTGVTTSTGTGNTVLSASPTFTGVLSAATVTSSGIISTTSVGNSSTRSLSSINTAGGINSAGIHWSGASGSGTGGSYRVITDDGTERWLSGVLGSAGATNYVLYDLANSTARLTVNSSTGAATFANVLSASNLSGTNTGDVTIGTANGLSLASQAISLALSSTSTTGALSSTDWNTFNGKQASGSYITALTGDVTASGPGSSAATVAKIQGTTVSGTTGTTNVAFSASPTFTGTVSAATVTASGIVSTTNTGNSATRASSSINTAGGINAAGLHWTGASGSGTGGNYRAISDDGNERWLMGLLGGAGATNFSLYDLVNSALRISVDGTTGAITLGTASTTPQHVINSQTTTGAQIGTLTNVPVAGNPAGYLQTTINGTTRYIPFW